MEPESSNVPCAPFPLAMVICDAVWRDPATGKWTLLGCFSAIEARVFPCFRPNLAVFVSLTDGRGKTPLKLRLVDVDEEQEPIAGAETQVEFPGPRIVADGVFHFCAYRSQGRENIASNYSPVARHFWNGASWCLMDERRQSSQASDVPVTAPGGPNTPTLGRSASRANITAVRSRFLVPSELAPSTGPQRFPASGTPFRGPRAAWQPR